MIAMHKFALQFLYRQHMGWCVCVSSPTCAIWRPMLASLSSEKTSDQ